MGVEDDARHAEAVRIAYPLFWMFARELLAARAPDLEWVEFEGAGHYLQMERPREVRARIEEFVEGRGLLR